MKCEIREESGVAVVALTGDVDLETSPRLRKALLDCVSVKRGVLVDMAGVSYIDSSGIASLVEAFQTARKSRTGFGLVAVSPAALRVLQLARLDGIFAIHETLADGVASVAS